jgi:phosphoserine aminotransferase
MSDVPDRVQNDISLFCFKDLDPLNGRKSILFRPSQRVGYSSQVLVHGDLSYTAPTGNLEYSQVHSFVFRTQYGFGMTPGLIVWISGEPFYGKVMALLEKRKEFNAFSSNPGRSRFTSASVNIDKLYVLGMIIKDLQNRGLQMVRNEVKYKSIVLHNALKESRRFEPLIPDLKAQSENIICGRSKASKEELEKYFSKYGIEVDLYDDVDGNGIVRMANYPAHSKEQVEYLSDLLVAF